MATIQQFWFKMVEYKLCFGKVFEFKYDFFDNTWMYMNLLYYLNENVYPLLDEDANYIVNAKNKGYREIIQDFVQRSLFAKNFYPETLSQIEEYYFGITEPFFTCEEVFWIEYLVTNTNKTGVIITKTLGEEFMEQIEEAIFLSQRNTIDLLVYAA